MAFGMWTGLVVSLLVLASQWTSLLARSLPGDYDTQYYTPTHGGYDQDQPSFVGRDNPWDAHPTRAAAPGRAPTRSARPNRAAAPTRSRRPTWAAAPKGSTRPYHAVPPTANARPHNYEESNSFATSTDELPFDTFIDSPETVQSSGASFAASTTYTPSQEVHTQSEYENDEVFFDTSDADTVYRANEDGLSLSATGLVNATSVDDTLASLAKAMGGCGTGNPIDDCWRCDPDWKSHRQALASCAIGFGRNAIGGKNGPIYTVTNNGDDLTNPQPGTLRYGVTRDGPLWIIFGSSMTIQLKGELWVTAYKTLDGRGAEVHITGTSQITIQNTNNVIVHGLHIHDIKVSGPSTLRASPTQLVKRPTTDGDGLHIWGSHDVWIDHCYLARAVDGLLDVTRGSTMVTVSNNFFEQHDKTMLLGADPSHTMDRNMKVTVAFNKFGPGLVQRLPRCRFGVFHVLNNDYSSGWSIYAIGGSEDPTILSQGNYFSPSGNKEVTKRINDNGPEFGGWQNWNWASSGDVFMNGAFFTGSGAKATTASVYAKAFSTSSRPGNMVPALTKGAGPLSL